LKDPNSKVNLLALVTLHDIVQCIAPFFSNVANLTITTVASNLASAKTDICQAASDVLDSFAEYIGN
jgi:hypothetical protein